MYGETVRSLAETLGESSLEVSKLKCTLSEEEILRRKLSLRLTFAFFDERLRFVIDHYLECANQSCCKSLASSIENVTIGFYKGFSQELLTPQPLDEEDIVQLEVFYLTQSEDAYLYLFEKVGCPLVPMTNDQIKEKLKMLKTKLVQ